jgi:hypothetical protein
MNLDKLALSLMCVALWAACMWNAINGLNPYGSMCMALAGLACFLMAKKERGTR